MKFIKLGGKYTLKNCWWMALLWLIPSVFVGLCCGPFQVIEFMNVYPTSTISGFGDIFNILMPFGWQQIVFGILAILLVSVVLSMVVGQAESHMRSGKLKFKEIFSYVNNDILVVLVNVVMYVLIEAVLTFIFGSIIFLFHLMTSGLSNTPTVLCSIIAIILCVCLLVLNTLAVSMFVINIPNMISNGYSFKEGVSSTTQLVGKSTFKLLLAYLLPYLLIIPLVSIFCRTNILWLFNIILFLILIVYYSGLSMTAYFELSDTSRYDNRKYYNYM